ncbi:hypothetical protein [Desulfopila inferna]|nr:hypothetical protein [Desulfopila inferna]
MKDISTISVAYLLVMEDGVALIEYFQAHYSNVMLMKGYGNVELV